MERNIVVAVVKSGRGVLFWIRLASAELSMTINNIFWHLVGSNIVRVNNDVAVFVKVTIGWERYASFLGRLDILEAVVWVLVVLLYGVMI